MSTNKLNFDNVWECQCETLSSGRNIKSLDAIQLKFCRALLFSLCWYIWSGILSTLKNEWLWIKKERKKSMTRGGSCKVMLQHQRKLLTLHNFKQVITLCVSFFFAYWAKIKQQMRCLNRNKKQNGNAELWMSKN